MSIQTFANRVHEGAVRLGIVGFHKEMEIAMNLFEMSSIDGRARARESAHKETHQTVWPSSTRQFGLVK